MVLPLLLYQYPLFPLGNFNNQNFVYFIGDNNTISNETKDLNSSLVLKPQQPPTHNLALLFNQFNNALPQNCSDRENVSQSKYYGIDELHQLKVSNKEKFLFLFHINLCSRNKKFENFQNMLQPINSNFNVIFITESREI